VETGFQTVRFMPFRARRSHGPYGVADERLALCAPPAALGAAAGDGGAVCQSGPVASRRGLEQAGKWWVHPAATKVHSSTVLE